MHAAEEQTSYYLGALHLQASFLAHKSCLPLCCYTGNQNTHFTLLYKPNHFPTLPEHSSWWSLLVSSCCGSQELQDFTWGVREEWAQEVLLGTALGSSKGPGCRAGNICRLAVTSALSLKHRNVFLDSCGHINSGKLISLLLKGKPFWILKEKWPCWQEL